MKALIPAAGKGTRLRPLTNQKPKALVEVKGEALIRHLVEELRSLGVEEISVIKGYLGDKLEANLKDFEDLDFLEQEEQLGTAHAVGTSSFKDPFLVVNGDVYIHPENLERVIRSFEENRPEAVIGSKEVESPEEFGVLEVENGVVKGIEEKPDNPPSNLINTGVYLFKPLIYDYIERTGMSERGEYEITDSIQLMIQDGHAVTHTPFKKYWVDVGRREDLERARNVDG
ncbi:MAG: sugar phosphate nucleotidyltransferase [Candidatus Aenigmatarchaeota archaeon]